jgi:Tfp pilus assembly major pilin PilA
VRRRWPPEVRVRWPPEVRANERSTEGEGETEASKALRWTECLDYEMKRRTQMHTNAHKCTQTHTNAHMCTQTHTNAHKCTHVHTHAKNLTTFSEACWMNDRELSPLIKKLTQWSRLSV